MKRLRTAIYGGTFNPMHQGHIRLGQWLCDEGYIDELWFLISPLNPLKADSQNDILPDELRLHLASLAIEDNEKQNENEEVGISKLSVSDFEMSLPRPSYMVNTLKALRKSYPERDFALVIGADNWLCFNSWKKPDTIMRHHDIIIYPRKGYPIESTTLPSKVTLAADAPLFNISSTEIRESIAAGNYKGEWLTPSVWQEIQRLGLYQKRDSKTDEATK